MSVEYPLKMAKISKQKVDITSKLNSAYRVWFMKQMYEIRIEPVKYFLVT